MSSTPTTLKPAKPSLGTTIMNALRGEHLGGIMLIVAAVLAVICANSPLAGWFFAVRDTYLDLPLGFTTLHLSVAHWCADALLAVFFFCVGLDLKFEFTGGALRDWRQALTPMVAACGGVIVPALIFAAIVASSGTEGLQGWATPTATDIAFALAILAVVGRWLPSPLRVFLMTLAVVDDLIAIVIIAIFYAQGLQPLWLLGALVPILAYFFLVRGAPRFFAKHAWAMWLILLPIGAIAWLCMYQSGVHATIAGVVLGLVTPAAMSANGAKPASQVALEEEDEDAPAATSGAEAEQRPLAMILSDRVSPLSSAIAVPIFAFFSAGVAIGGWSGFVAALQAPVFWGIMVGLVLGKPIGIMASTWLITRTPLGRLDRQVTWTDLFGVSIVAGVGFTVALLVSDLSFGVSGEHANDAKIAILLASVLATVLSALWLAPRNRMYKNNYRDNLR